MRESTKLRVILAMVKSGGYCRGARKENIMYWTCSSDGCPFWNRENTFCDHTINLDLAVHMLQTYNEEELLEYLI